jgi:nicotinamidase/pyrazinamidase
MELAPKLKKNIEKTALIIVDVEGDFLPGGSLAVTDGDKVVEPLMRAAKLVDYVIATADAHHKDTIHFKIWPPHCVIGTPGAKLHPRVEAAADFIVFKGMSNADDGYSGFEGRATDGRTLLEILQDLNVTKLAIGGLATDYCVRATTLDALKEGFKVTLLLNGIRAVNINPLDGEKALKEMITAGAKPMLDTSFHERLVAEQMKDPEWRREYEKTRHEIERGE